MNSSIFRLAAGVAALTAVGLAAGEGSLWTAVGSREQGVASDPRASRVGDILTIVIAEAASQTASQNKNSSTTASIDAAVTQYLFPPASSAFGTHKGNTPSIEMGGTNSFSGGGQVSNTQAITARAAVVITDIMPNGNFVIAGARRMSFSGETQHIVLHGLVRPADVSSGNTLLSSNIADAHLEIVTEGSLNDAQKRGWISRIYSLLRPF
jgi:flagellar L-ring protein FlgH